MSLLTSEKFDDLMARSFENALSAIPAVAIGVSGGADSMALLWLLQGWCQRNDKALHVLSVDHGLREAAQEECALVASYCDGFDHVSHQLLQWDAPSDVRIQEEARKARYTLINDYCRDHDIQHLFLAHHEDDQAETVLFRLAKGSGLDGLSGMREMQDYEGLVLCRPLLNVAKQDLIETCEAESVSFVHDPSNDDDGYARVRLRQSMDVLAEEGLTAKRLSVTAMRMARAREALDVMAVRAESQYLLLKNTDRIEFNKEFLSEPLETVVRVILKGIGDLGNERDYAPRMEKLEDLAYALVNDLSFRKRTLGGVIFDRDDKAGRVILLCENSDG